MKKYYKFSDSPAVYEWEEDTKTLKPFVGDWNKDLWKKQTGQENWGGITSMPVSSKTFLEKNPGAKIGTGITIPNLTETLKEENKWTPPAGYKHIPDVASIPNYEKGTTQKRPGTEELWGKPITTAPIPSVSTSSTIESLTPEQLAQPKKDWTEEEIKQEYKKGFGEDYEPVAGQDWGTILKHHNTAGTSPQELREWMAKPEVQAQANKEKVLRNQLNTIEKGDEKNIVKTLIEAGFNANDITNIIATHAGQMPKWSKEAEKIEAEWKNKRAEAEKKIAEIEDKMISFFEKNESNVKEFDDLYKSNGLDKLKEAVYAKDEEINKVNNQLNNELLDASGRVIPQWMISGEKKLDIQRTTDTLNRLKAERTDLAKRYNNTWDEIVVRLGLKQKDIANEAANLKSQLDIYTGREKQINQKILEALSKGGVKFEEDKQELLNRIKERMAPTMATVAEELLKAKAAGTSKIINAGSELGLFYYDADNGTVRQVVEGTGKTPSFMQGLEMAVRKEIQKAEQNGKDDATIRRYIEAQGLDPKDFGYSIEQRMGYSMKEKWDKWNREVEEGRATKEYVKKNNSTYLEFSSKKGERGVDKEKKFILPL